MKDETFEMLERLAPRLRVGNLLDPHTFSNVQWVLHYFLGSKAESLGLGLRIWIHQHLAGSKQLWSLGLAAGCELDHP